MAGVGEPACVAGTVPRGAVRLEAEAAMGLDSVVTLALGLGTGGTAERSLSPGPRPRCVPIVEGLWPKGAAAKLGSHQTPQQPWRQQVSVTKLSGPLGAGQEAEGSGWAGTVTREAGTLGSPSEPVPGPSNPMGTAPSCPRHMPPTSLCLACSRMGAQANPGPAPG